MRTCQHCGIDKELGEFSKGVKICLPCVTLKYKGKSRYIDMPESERTIACAKCETPFVKGQPSQKFCSRDCSRTFAYKSTLEVKIGSFTIFNRDNFTCLYCGRSSVADSVKLTLDHVIAVLNGGRDIAGNLVTCCQPCNNEKLARPIHNLEMVQNEISKRNKLVGLSDDKGIKMPERRHVLKLVK